MMNYRLFLSSQHTLEGFDERNPDDMIEAISTSDGELPKGWRWLAGFYVRSADVVGFELVTADA